MSTLNIEIFNGKVVRLQTRSSGAVELVVSTNVLPSYYHNKPPSPGGVYDTCVAVIPRNRRKLVANFLLTDK